MLQIAETLVDRFDGGIINIHRSKDKRFSRILKHFDILNAKHRLVPLRSMEADGSVGNTEKLCQFVSANNKQYALGVVSGSSKAKIFERASLPVGAWGASTTGESSVGARHEGLLIEYKDKLYGGRAGTDIWSYAYLTNTFTDSDRTLATGYTSTNPLVGLVHSKDDILYIAYDNIVIKKNNATWTDPALTLPSKIVVTNLFEYGNYLGIGYKSKYYGGRSGIYLWDRDSSLTTLSESIDWGTEDLWIADQLDGYIIGVSVTPPVGSEIEPRLVIKKWTSGPEGKTFLEIPISDVITSGEIIPTKQKANNRLLFMMGIEINDVQYDGIWSVGRSEKEIDAPFALSLEILPNNDTAITSYLPLGFQLLGGYITVAYKDNGVYTTQRTNDDSLYSATSVYESLIFNNGDTSKKKDLLGISVMTEPLPSAGQVVVKYKKDAESSFTTILTMNTDNAISQSAVNIESSGAVLPNDYKEIQFRIESTGNAIITAFSFKERMRESRSY